MPPIIFWFLGAVGAVAAAKWLAGEARRINAELYPGPHDVFGDAPDRKGLATLRRDPSGIYRPD